MPDNSFCVRTHTKIKCALEARNLSWCGVLAAWGLDDDRVARSGTTSIDNGPATLMEYLVYLITRYVHQNGTEGFS